MTGPPATGSPGTGRPYLVGYAGTLSARPGEGVAVMAAADRAVSARAALVRVGAGDVTGEVHEEVAADLGEVTVGPQRTQVGSYATVAGARREWPAGPFAAAVLAMPTRTGQPQGLVSQAVGDRRWGLGLDAAGRPVAWASAGERSVTARGNASLVEGAWYLVAGGAGPDGGVRVVARPLPVTASWRAAADSAVVAGEGSAGDGSPAPVLGEGLPEATVVLAAVPGEAGAVDPPRPIETPGAIDTDGEGTDPADGGPVSCCFDGKLEHPRLLAGTLDDALVARLESGVPVDDRLLAGWDFSARLAGGGTSGTAVPGTGAGGCDAVLWNTPVDAVTGHGWDGAEQDHRLDPGHYGAVHFHSDDLDDCRWPPTIEVTLPDDLPSGAYAVRLAGEGGRADRVPFFVRPARPEASLLYLVPTASYLAYANDHPVADGSFSEATAGQTPVLYEADLLLHEHREWGLSCYDSHLDGSGVGISSARRPMVNMRPGHRYHVGSWQLASDLAVVDWLRAQGIAHDVATDADLHREGAALLSPYRAVVTGTHPEYYSTAMLDAVEAYVDAGGRLAYLGANGFYWRVAFDPERPWVMELRRGQAGSRAWESAPGECHFAFGGERGGLWRHLGRPPQRLTAVGYAAQGFDRSGWYRRMPDAADPRVAFAFEGVDAEVFGTAGTVGGGAVGQEIDRYDLSLGSPGDALLLATCEGLDEGYRRCVEELLFTVPGTSAVEDPDVRADLVYHVKPGGGAVFATGSIAWGGSLGVDPDVSRITANVLRRFADPAPLPW